MHVIYTYVCMYTHTYVCMYACSKASSPPLQIHVCIVYVYTYPCMYTHMHVCKHTCMYVCMLQSLFFSTSPAAVSCLRMHTWIHSCMMLTQTRHTRMHAYARTHTHAYPCLCTPKVMTHCLSHFFSALLLYAFFHPINSNSELSSDV